ncbi:SGNH/GDSL hydrolase family protein [Streptomonospora sediminis]
MSASAAPPARRPRAALRALAHLTAAALTLTGAAAGSAHADTAAERTRALAAEYVALGDSFTAGPLIPPPHDRPTLCMRSGRNYPNLVADALGARRFTDASCIAATTGHMTSAQELLLTTNPPQLDSLTPHTTLVTLGIGGMDLGFVEIMLSCIALSLTDSGGAPCRDNYVDHGHDELRARLDSAGGRIGDVLGAIRERSPDATIAVVGYLELLPSDDPCLQVPFAQGDIPYMYGIWSELNAELEKQAAAAGAVFVDTSGPGHDMCAPPGQRWVEGIVPSRPTFPVHPNATGMAVVADRVLSALGAEEVERNSPLA